MGGQTPRPNRGHARQDEVFLSREFGESFVNILNRRQAMTKGIVALGTLNAVSLKIRAQVSGKPGQKTQFQIACMTLPYNAFPLSRALQGLKKAGYRFAAMGTTHQNTPGKSDPVLPQDASLETARQTAGRFRDLGLEPVMMFGPSPDQVDPLKARILQAEAAKVPQILVMGNTRGNDLELWVKNFKEIGPFARDHGVMVVLKQHGGNTGTGDKCARVIQEVNDAGVGLNYDAGNIMDYHKIDPISDLKKCAGLIRSFCIKDHRQYPKDEDCGPGLGEIDHYKLLAPVANASWTIPLCCENIFAPLLPRPKDPDSIDGLARRAREFLELVVKGIQF